MKKSSILLPFVALMLAGAFVSFPARVQAEESEAEKKEAEDEAREERKKELERDQPIYHTATGVLKVVPVPEGKQMPEIVGSITTGNAVIQLKLGEPQLYKSLLASDGKPVELIGKLRNKGKYLIVLQVNKK